MSLLAHLVSCRWPAEPAATQALAYLLRSEEAARAFVQLLIPAGIPAFRPSHIVAEKQHEDGQPDLTVRDREDQVRILVENKFWSGLTKHQPVTYLKQLPENVAAALLFVVPEKRLRALWDELCRLCEQAGVHLEEESSQGSLRWIHQKCREQDVHRHTLAITSWKHVLETLDRTDQSEAYRCDVSQLRSLTDKMDQGAFLPLRPEEVTGEDIPRRLTHYSGMIDSIVETLVRDEIAYPKANQRSSGDFYTGRYLYLQGKYLLWLGVDLGNWKQWGITPIWSEHDTTDAESGLRGRMQKARHVFPQAQANGNWLCLPIRLTTGVDRDRVVQDAVVQLRCIGEQLDENF